MKLIVFGDSFSNYTHCPRPELNWANMLASELGLPLINFGVSGSGLNYSLHKMIEYVTSNQYHPKDIIIFVSTQDNRIFSKNMPDPSMGSFFNFTPEMRRLNKDWFLNNFEHAMWAIDHLYHPTINFESLKVFSFLKSWAQANLENNVILIRGLGVEIIDKTRKDYDLIIQKIITPDKNFFPLLNPTFGDITANEYGNNLSLCNLINNHWLPGVDPRVNHLSPVNRLITVEILKKILSTKDVSHWNNDRFIKNIYVNEQSVKRLPKDFF